MEMSEGADLQGPSGAVGEVVRNSRQSLHFRRGLDLLQTRRVGRAHRRCPCSAMCQRPHRFTRFWRVSLSDWFRSICLLIRVFSGNTKSWRCHASRPVYCNSEDEKVRMGMPIPNSRSVGSLELAILEGGFRTIS